MYFLVVEKILTTSAWISVDYQPGIHGILPISHARGHLPSLFFYNDNCSLKKEFSIDSSYNLKFELKRNVKTTTDFDNNVYRFKFVPL